MIYESSSPADWKPQAHDLARRLYHAAVLPHGIINFHRRRYSGEYRILFVAYDSYGTEFLGRHALILTTISRRTSRHCSLKAGDWEPWRKIREPMPAQQRLLELIQAQHLIVGHDSKFSSI